MPRRSSARSSAKNSSLAHSSSSSFLPHSNSLSDDLRCLRTNWKWAAFSQFFFTFSPLLAMDDVSIKDVEDDLVLGSSIVLPRIMVRLLYTLSYDRKVNLDNWQTTLRRQYNKRDPMANPIGPEPVKDGSSSRYASVIEETASPEPESSKLEEDGDTNSPADEDSTPDHPHLNRQSSKDVTIQVKDENDDEEPSKPSQSQKKILDEAREQSEEQKETIDWLSLPMLEKLDSLHLVTEWQFQSPNRVRTLMKTDDEQATWRIEPIGYDAKRNAYWLIGADRLWIQRVPPKTPKAPTLKRKRAANPKPTQSKSSISSKRPRLQTTGPRTPNKGRSAPTTDVLTPSSTRRGRAAKEQANKKLDAQAKELAELNRQAALLSKGGSSRTRSSARSNSTQQQSGSSTTLSTSKTRTTRASAAASRPLGTRLSARLRGPQDDEWQAIPEEWLNGDDKGKSREASPEEDDEDSGSELTELSEESDENSQPEEEHEHRSTTDDIPQAPPLPDDFIEWETIAVTLEEWEHIADRWQNASHYAEKALCKVLRTTIVPVITEELRAIENQRRLEEAIVHRKRSSRIALKESEKEEAKLAARKKAEEEEKMSRARRAEARQRKEEAERMKREHARELRRKEREAQEEREARQAEEKERKQKEKEEREKARRSQPQNAGNMSLTSNGVLLLHPQRSTYGTSMAGSTSGSRTPAGDDWELDCEICHRHGTNVDDGTPMMCCGLCSKWQHITCHDQADVQAGRSRRNWDEVEFICRHCQSRVAGVNSAGYRNGHNQQQYPPLQQNAHLSLRIPPASHSSVPYNNHVPYGQGVSNYSAGSRLSNGYTDVLAMNNHRGKGYGVSDVRSALPTQPHPQQKQISFAHYQPQHQGFTSRATSQALPQYSSSTNHVQAYGQPPLGQDPQYSNTVTNSIANPYLQSTGWNTTRTSMTQPLGYPSTSSYVGSAERTGASSTSPASYQHQWHPHHPNQNLPSNSMYQSSS